MTNIWKMVFIWLVIFITAIINREFRDRMVIHSIATGFAVSIVWSIAGLL